MSSVNPQRILVVEDSVSFATALAAMLVSNPPIPLDVSVTYTLKSALEKLKQAQFDLIITDLDLPDSRHMETVSRLNEAAPNIPVIVLTGSETDNLGITAIQSGAQDYLLKGDLKPGQLHRAVVYALERSRAQSLEKERIKLYKEREDFMATLTHDLKNPLLGANRILQMLADETLGPLNDKQRDVLEKLVDSNRGLLMMIRNLLEVYRYEKDSATVCKEITDLRRLLVSYIDEIEPSIEHKGIQLITEVPQAMDEVCADPNSMLRVFQNLVENAVKFTPCGGRITLRLWQDHDKALFEISDTGPGIPPQERAELFQRFHQGQLGQRCSPGTGLGLYLCRQIVEAHHGDIRFSEGKDDGTTFRVEIPISI
jgi:two-component system, sensor histidine kinase and response regulator